MFSIFASSRPGSFSTVRPTIGSNCTDRDNLGISRKIIGQGSGSESYSYWRNGPPNNTETMMMTLSRNSFTPTLLLFLLSACTVDFSQECVSDDGCESGLCLAGVCQPPELIVVDTDVGVGNDTTLDVSPDTNFRDTSLDATDTGSDVMDTSPDVDVGPDVTDTSPDIDVGPDVMDTGPDIDVGPDVMDTGPDVTDTGPDVMDVTDTGPDVTDTSPDIDVGPDVTDTGPDVEPACSLLDTHCEGDLLMICAEDQTGFEVLQDCNTDGTTWGSNCTNEECVPRVCEPHDIVSCELIYATGGYFTFDSYKCDLHGREVAPYTRNEMRMDERPCHACPDGSCIDERPYCWETVSDLYCVMVRDCNDGDVDSCEDFYAISFNEDPIIAEELCDYLDAIPNSCEDD